MYNSFFLLFKLLSAVTKPNLGAFMNTDSVQNHCSLESSDLNWESSNLHYRNANLSKSPTDRTEVYNITIS